MSFDFALVSFLALSVSVAAAGAAGVAGVAGAALVASPLAGAAGVAGVAFDGSVACAAARPVVAAKVAAIKTERNFDMSWFLV